MKKLISLILVVFMLSSVPAFAIEYGSEWEGYTSSSTKTFKDVPAGHWALESIDRVVKKGWFNGYPDGTFHPDDIITRAEAMTVFVNFLGLELKTVNTSSYHDVSRSEWYSPYIEAGKDLFPKETTFNGQTPFNPDMPMTREATVYALVTALNYAHRTQIVNQAVLNMFNDQNSISTAIKPYFVVAVNFGMVSGYPDGTIRAQDPLTRAEFATLLRRGSEIGYDADPEAVKRVNVTPSGVVNMTIGEEKIVTAYAEMIDGSNKDYPIASMTTDQPNVIEITGNKIKAVSQGTATVRFLNDSKLADTIITVTVTIPTGRPSFDSVDYLSTTTESTETIIGRVSDPSNANLTLDMDGVNVRISSGRFEKTVSLNPGLNTFVFTLTNEYGIQTTKTVKIQREESTVVAEPTITGFSWSVSSVSLDAGQSKRIKLFAHYSDNTKEDVTSEYRLVSSNTNVASISEDGVITALSAGTANISFSSAVSGLSVPRSLKVDVNAVLPQEPEREIEQERELVAYEWSTSNFELNVGEYKNVKVYAVYDDGSKEEDNSFVLQSNNPAIVAVSGNKLTAMSEGTASISFSASNQGISMPRPLKVTVNEVVSSGGHVADAELVGLEWSVSSVNIRVGQSATIKLMGVYSDGSKRDLSAECGVYSDDEGIASFTGASVTGISEGSTELWFSNLPKSNLRMPGAMTINVID